MQSQLGKSLRAQKTAPPRPAIRSSARQPARQPTEQPRKFLPNPSITPTRHQPQKSARSRSESVLLSLVRLEAESVCVHMKGAFAPQRAAHPGSPPAASTRVCASNHRRPQLLRLPQTLARDDQAPAVQIFRDVGREDAGYLGLSTNAATDATNRLCLIFRTSRATSGHQEAMAAIASKLSAAMGRAGGFVFSRNPQDLPDVLRKVSSVVRSRTDRKS